MLFGSVFVAFFVFPYDGDVHFIVMPSVIGVLLAVVERSFMFCVVEVFVAGIAFYFDCFRVERFVDVCPVALFNRVSLFVVILLWEGESNCLEIVYKSCHCFVIG